jgi:deoxycytidylate deaminase
MENVCEYKYITCPCGEEIDVTDVEYVDRNSVLNRTTAKIQCICERIHEFGKDFPKLKTHPYVIHAEANAITRAARLGIATDGAYIYTTTLPCSECAKMIVASGIKKVYYVETYKADRTVKYLQDNKIELIRMEKNENV